MFDEILEVINDNPLPEGSPLWLEHYVNNMRKFDYDFNIAKKINLNNKSKLDITASVTNIYNRENIFYFNRIAHERVNQLPFLPYLKSR